jgi:hypothetical protein
MQIKFHLRTSFLRFYIIRVLHFIFGRKIMDDTEYYSLMNRSSSYALRQALKKQREKNHAGKTDLPVLDKNFRDLEVRQGEADAQMLKEKSEMQ